MRRIDGWSLKELLIVIGLIVLLAALVYPVVQLARYRSYEARCRANLWNCALKYQELKDQGYKGRELRRQLLWWMSDNPQVGSCPMTGHSYITITDFSPLHIGNEVWEANREVIVLCHCHPDLRRGYKLTSDCAVTIPQGQGPACWFLSAVERGNHISVEYAPDIVRVQR
jgi:type II secretory pathway pseudopilin PulG